MIRPIILFDKINNINSMFSYVTVSASEVYIALVCMYFCLPNDVSRLNEHIGLTISKKS